MEPTQSQRSVGSMDISTNYLYGKGRTDPVSVVIVSVVECDLEYDMVPYIDIQIIG